jgi:hypothetical protein
MISNRRVILKDKLRRMWKAWSWSIFKVTMKMVKHSIQIANGPSEDVAKFKYLGTTLTDQNCMHKEIKSRLNLVNACYYLFQSRLSSCLLSRNVKVKIYKTIILSVLLYRCETWSLTLREEHRLREFENRVLRRIFGPKRDELTRE